MTRTLQVESCDASARSTDATSGASSASPRSHLAVALRTVSHIAGPVLEQNIWITGLEQTQLSDGSLEGFGFRGNCCCPNDAIWARMHSRNPPKRPVSTGRVVVDDQNQITNSQVSARDEPPPSFDSIWNILSRLFWHGVCMNSDYCFVAIVDLG